MTAAERPSGSFLPGTSFGRYEIVRVRGVGGMGTVYEAIHTGLRKRVALKVLNRELAFSAEARLRFLREAELAARIQHPHVVDVTDVGTVDELPYLVMEFLDGEDLGAVLERQGRLGVEETVDLLLPLMAGLAAGHALGIVHRDLKPQNVFLARRPDGEIVPKALDFGVSKLLTEPDGGVRLTRTGMVCGTVQYMSPEQARGALEISPASDQYAVGGILYECLTGHPAYPGDRVLDILSRVSNGAFARPREIRPELDAELEAIILRAMAFAPADRYESLFAFGHALLWFGSDAARFKWSKTFGAVPARGVPTQPYGVRDTEVLPEVPEGPVVAAAADTKMLPATPPELPLVPTLEKRPPVTPPAPTRVAAPRPPARRAALPAWVLIAGGGALAAGLGAILAVVTGPPAPPSTSLRAPVPERSPAPARTGAARVLAPGIPAAVPADEAARAPAAVPVPPAAKSEVTPAARGEVMPPAPAEVSPALDGESSAALREAGPSTAGAADARRILTPTAPPPVAQVRASGGARKPSRPPAGLAKRAAARPEREQPADVPRPPAAEVKQAAARAEREQPADVPRTQNRAPVVR